MMSNAAKFTINNEGQHAAAAARGGITRPLVLKST